jgi:hypothetical protein
MKKTSLLFALLFALVLSACATSATTPASPTAAPKYTITHSQGQTRFVVIDKELSADRAELQNISNTICAGKTICVVMFWDDKDNVASTIPMTNEQTSAKIAQYNLNKNTGLDRLLICSSDGC